jgi:hypothetical protein
MGQLDEVSQSIGRLQSSVESHSVAHSEIMRKLDNVHQSIVKQINMHDDDISAIKKELDERRGALKVYAIVASIITGLAVRLFETIPAILK